MENMAGKTVRISDHFQAIIDSNEILRFLVQSFKPSDGSYIELRFGDGPAVDGAIITSEVKKSFVYYCMNRKNDRS